MGRSNTPRGVDAGVAGSHARNHPVGRRVLKVLAALLAVAFVVLAFFTWKLQSNITTIDIAGLGGRPSKESASGPVNILVMGSDSREGEGNQGYGRFDGARSDTTLLVHISGDRQSALVVSIPRDSMVEFPGCPEGVSEEDSASTTAPPTPSVTVDADGNPTTVYPRHMFNEAFNLGGPTCTLAQVEHSTRVYIDHFAVVDFAGFKSMVDALGGVTVCVPRPIQDEDSNLDIPAGTSTLDGEQALAFVRTRKAIGDGSDLNRIRFQQAFLAAMVRDATSSELLLRPDRLVRFLDAATKSLTTDPDLGGVTRLTDLANQVRNIPPRNIRFVTVPVESYPADPNRVQWDPAAENLWSAIREDRVAQGTSPSPTATTPSADLVAPSQVRVRVMNRTDTGGLARTVSEDLAAQGFSMAAPGTGQVEGAPDAARVRYPEGLAEEAATVAAAFPGAEIEVDYEATGDTVTVELGANAPPVVKVPTAGDDVRLPSSTPSGSPSADPSASITGQFADEDTLCG